MKPLAPSAVIAAGAAGGVEAQDPVWDANTVVLEAQELAPGVFAVIPTGAETLAAAGRPVATTGGFVIGDTGVLVIESMLNARLNAQLFDLIAARTDRPVRYLVNTSFHGDHSDGNHYLPEEIDIIQREAMADCIDTHFEADTAFMMQKFGAGRGLSEIEPTDADLLVGAGSSLSIDLRGLSVVHRVYGLARTGGDLFVPVPSANVLWTGNAIVAEAPALPWLLEGHLIETRKTLEAVRADFNSEPRVVPGHGPVTDLAALDWTIGYLSAVETEVRAALSEWLDLDDTVARVALPDYQGYALFCWVHPSPNVPAAYRDLQ